MNDYILGRNLISERIQNRLAELSKQRVERTQVVQTEDGPEIGWVIYENEMLLNLINKERMERQIKPAVYADVARATREAGGHVDYVKKVGLYCAELAMGVERTEYF